MKDRNVLYPFLVVVLLVLATMACGGSDNEGEKVDESEAAPTSPPPTAEVYKVGDVIQVEDHTIVLSSAELDGDVLKASFTIENKGSEDLAISSMMSFEAKDTDGTKLESEIFDCGSSLDGTVLPGDKLKGDVCWSGAEAAAATIKIYYRADLFGSGAVVWEVKK